MKKLKFYAVIVLIILFALILNGISYAADYTVNLSTLTAVANVNNAAYTVNLTDLTLTSNGSTNSIKTYTLDELDNFILDYQAGSLPGIYITEFLFDGVSAVKSPDLDNFVETASNDTKIKTLDIKAININTTGNIEFKGELTGGMIAVNTNGITGEINLILNGVNLNTDSKKTPVIYVYNKDVTYTGCKVTIKTVAGTENYLEGGKLKKVSLVGSDALNNYANSYSGTAKTNYTTYTNYYGIYTLSQISNILFAKEQADREDLADGDPYYFYKASGAISSDIDLYFEGNGSLQITSKNKEGVETKGNLTFLGSTGDYVIYAQDDCLNTTTSNSNNASVRNTLTIDVNSMVAVVDIEADEGDAIDSNGSLIINGGTIVAVAHPGQDSGIDAETGIVINGGTILATGDMLDQISNQSTQKYITFNVSGISDGTLVAILDSNNNAIAAYKTDRAYTKLVYSSADLDDGTYYLYKEGNIIGIQLNGFYSNVASYTNGTQLTSAQTGSQTGMMGPGGNKGGMMGFGENMGPGQMNGDNYLAQNTTNNSNNVPLIVLAVLVTLLVIVIIIAVIANIKKKKNNN